MNFYKPLFAESISKSFSRKDWIFEVKVGWFSSPRDNFSFHSASNGTIVVHLGKKCSCHLYYHLSIYR